MRMKKRWLAVMAVLMAAVMVFGAVPAMADTGTDSAGEVPPAALGVRAPRVAPVGEEVTIGVFERRSQEPVAGAGVWALSRESAAELRSQVEALREAEGTAEIDHESLLNSLGQFLGVTGEDGAITHIFAEEGLYILVAFKPGYRPGITATRIGEPPAALGVRAPRVAPVGEEVTIGVFERRSQEPVAGAGIWALPRGAAESLRARMEQLRQGGTDLQAALDEQGYFIGRTGEGGTVTHTFDQPGPYVLVALKEGYRPGFTLTFVRPVHRALGIRGPRVVPAGEEFTLTVIQRQTQEPVGDAGVWALSRENAASLREAFAHLKEKRNQPGEAPDYAALVEGIGGRFLGRTADDGTLVCTFEEAGHYLLITVKAGYIPGIAPLFVREHPASGEGAALESAAGFGAQRARAWPHRGRNHGGGPRGKPERGQGLW